MVDFRRLSTKAKDLVEKRGGTEALKRDAEQLKDIAKGPGTMSEKAKRAAAALKEPGAKADRPASAAEGTAPDDRARAERKVGGEERGKHKHAGGGKAKGAGNGAGGAKAKQGAVQSEPQGGGDEPAV